MIAKRVFYTGRVQGVGFRYSTLQIAEQYHVLGWVRNLPDGRVELQVKGLPDKVDTFLKEIREESRLSSFIQHFDEQAIDVELLSNSNTFSIRQ